MKSKQTNQTAAATESIDLDDHNLPTRSARFLLQIINGLRDPVVLQDRQHRWVWVNDALCDLLGQDRSHLIGKSDADFWPSAPAQMLWEQDEQIFRTGLAGETEAWIAIATGDRRCIATQKSLLYDEAGEAFLVAVLRDVTASKMAQDLQAAQQRFQLVIDNLPQTIWWKDCSGVYQGCNRAAAKAAGLDSPSEIVGKTDDDLPWTKEQADFDRGGDRDIIQSGQPQLHQIDRPQTDGRPAWLDINKIPLCNAAGEVLGILMTIEDITERKRIEAALQHSEERFRTLTMNVPIAIYRCLCDSDWTIEYISDFFETLTGYPASDFMGQQVRTWQSIIHPDDRQKVGQAVEAAIAIHQPFEIEYRILHRDGSICWVYEKGQGKFDPSGNLLYLTGALLDISDRKRAEVALQHREAQFRNLTNHLPATIYRCLCDQDWTRIFVSDFAEELTGYPAAEFIGNAVRTWISVIHPDDRSVVEQALYEALAAGQPYILEFRILHRDGSIRWVYEKGQGTFDQTGNLLYLDGAIFDISDRKLAEAALHQLNGELEEHIFDRTVQLEQEIQEHQQTEIELRESQQRLALLIEQTPLAVIEWSPQLEVTEWNSAAEQIFGYQREEAIGKPLGFLIDSHQETVNESIAQIVLNQRSPRRSIGENLTKFGQPIICEWHDYPLITAEGKLVGFASLAQDVTDRKRTEEVLKRQLTAIEASLNGIALCSAEGHFIYMNPAHAEAYGYDDPKVLIGLHWSVLYDDLERQRYEQEIMPAFRQQGRWRGESIGRRRDGSTFLEEVSLTLTSDGSLVCVVQDITDRKLAETAIRKSEMQLRQRAEQLEFALQELQRTQAQLIQSEKMSSLGQLVAGVAHEINNPVNFIAGNLTYANDYMQDLIGLLQVYQQHCPDPIAAVQAQAEAIDLDFLMADLPKLLSSMHVGVDRIQTIVRSLRNFSRMDESEKKAVDLHDGIDSTLIILQNRLKALPDRVEIEVVKQYGSLPKIECYASQLNQVFMNLMSNAIDAIEERLVRSPNPLPRIAISTLMTETNVQILIADNGAGIPSEILPRLFDPFFTTKPIGKGTGMGLSISYQIITEKHGGSLNCRSASGAGTEFAIVLPIESKSINLAHNLDR
ncbi:MAG: PAS domain S-box protein [Leptolyngbyaceae cyanobacterium SM1_3_5]|nr:PAS domain S-box protein [Leptolyngbyaceae cyanobacterium SM1_3_5]